MADKSLNECPTFGPFEDSLNIDSPTPYCPDCKDETPSQKDVAFLESLVHEQQKKGLGQAMLCDPMQTGSIINDLSRPPNRNTIYRYSRGVRGADEAMTDMFTNIIVIDEQGVAHPVPIIWGTQERAVAAVIQTNVRKDNSQVVDRIRLPMLSIYSSGFAMNMERYTYHNNVNYFRQEDGKPGLLFREKRDRDTVFGLARGLPIDISYTLTAWTLYVEDMNQILEQILLKFSPIAYIRVQGVQWETGVNLDSIQSNIDLEPGDRTQRVIKFQFEMTAETYIPQPIVRKKTVLSTEVEFANSVNEEEITEILARIETSV